MCLEQCLTVATISTVVHVLECNHYLPNSYVEATPNFQIFYKAIGGKKKWSLFVVLFSFHFITCLLTRFILFVNCLFIPSLPYSVCLYSFYFLTHRLSLHILDPDPLPVPLSVADIFSWPVTYLFTLLTQCLKFWISIKFKLSIFFYSHKHTFPPQPHTLQSCFRSVCCTFWVVFF